MVGHTVEASKHAHSHPDRADAIHHMRTGDAAIFACFWCQDFPSLLVPQEEPPPPASRC